MSLTILSLQDYKDRRDTIYYGKHPTPFGQCFISILDSSICGLHFITQNDEDSLLQEMRSIWHLADFVQDQRITQDYTDSIFQAKPISIPLIVKGTFFQTAVWKSLLSIPHGSTVHYEEIAIRAGYPTATRAAAHAVARNPISILIPCHRVIYKSGKIGKYRWGSNLKKALLEQERAVFIQL